MTSKSQEGMHFSCHTENDFEICTASFPEYDTVKDKIDPSSELAVLKKRFVRMILIFPF